MNVTTPIPPALRLLGRLWLEEVRPNDLRTIRQIAQFAELLPNEEQATELADELAAEYYRLLGLNLPPYESIFVDPSGMLNAPGTARVEALYREAGWEAPAGTRSGAPDHIGLELLALADLWPPEPAASDELAPENESSESEAGPFQRLHARHLALWAPAFLLTLSRLDPAPFYGRLAELTLDLLLETLPGDCAPTGKDPFPSLPAAPKYRGNTGEGELPSEMGELPPAGAQEGDSLAELVQRLSTPCLSGLFITRQDIARIGQALGLPGPVGERAHMLKNLFQQAGQYETVEALLQALAGLLDAVEGDYLSLASSYPPWKVYAAAWCSRLDATRQWIRMDYT